MSELRERIEWWLKYFNEPAETEKWENGHPDYRDDPTSFDETALENDLRDVLALLPEEREEDDIPDDLIDTLLEMTDE
jgi:hypothetical protein